MAEILVIDDDAVIRSLIRRALELHGHQVSEAVDGSEGIRVYHERSPQLVLCDLIMPEKEGLETIEELCRDSPQVRIIAMSGGVMNGVYDLLPVAKRLGARAVLSKPFTTATLIGVVKEVLAAGLGG